MPPASRLLGAFPVTSGLLALLVATFLVEYLEGGTTDTLVLVELGASYPPLVFNGQPWRLLTAALLHVGLFHLLANGWALLQLGRLSEVTFGGAVTLALFVFTAITGSGLSLLTLKVSAGASGALFGIEGALLAFFFRHRERLTPQGALLLRQLLIWSGVMLVFGFVIPGIDWLGHLGGLGGGLAVGWALRPYRGRTGRLAFSCAVVAALLLVASIVAAALARRPVQYESEAVRARISLPSSYTVEEAGGLVRIKTPAGGILHVARARAPDAEAAIEGQLAGERADGLVFEEEAASTPAGFWRRGFRYGQVVGFAQASCVREDCLVVVAAAPELRSERLLRELEPIAESAEPL